MGPNFGSGGGVGANVNGGRGWGGIKYYHDNDGGGGGGGEYYGVVVGTKIQQQ